MYNFALVIMVEPKPNSNFFEVLTSNNLRSVLVQSLCVMQALKICFQKIWDFLSLL